LVAIAIAIALVIVAAAIGHAWGGDPLFEGAKTATLLVLAGAAVLPFWGGESSRLAGLLQRVGPGTVALAVLAAVLVAHMGRSMMASPFSFVIDENLYLFQSATFFGDPRGIRVGDELGAFFRIRQTYTHDGWLNGQYPPGWPFFLAGLRLVRLEYFAGTLVFGLILLGIVALTRSVRGSWESALLAVALTTASFTAYVTATSHFAHGLGAAAALGSAVAAIGASRRDGVSSFLLWLLGGCLLGWVVATRPLTGVAGALGLASWMVQRRHLSMRAVLGVGLGAAPLVVATLAYNGLVTGGILTFGYDLAHEGLQSLGFGVRGQIWYDTAGQPAAQIVRFGAVDAVRNLLGSLGAVVEYWPGALLLVVLAVTLERGGRVELSRLLPFAFLPAACAFYFMEAPRLYFEAVPFAMVGTAVLANRLAERDPRLTRLVIWVSVAFGFFGSIGSFTAYRAVAEPFEAHFEVVEEERARSGRLLLMVSQNRAPGDVSEEWLEALYWYNSERSGDVVVGRDVPDVRAAAMRRFPGHRPFRVVTSPVDGPDGWAAPSLEPLARP
jgi:hypothetical protein